MSQVLNQAEQSLNALSPSPFPLTMGAASTAVEHAVLAMSKRDWLVCGPRFRISAALRGCPPERLLQPNDGAKPYKLAPSTMHPADRALHAVGLAMATKTPVLCILGEASVANGALTEALNVAQLNTAPVLFFCVCRNLEHSPVTRQSAASPIALAQAYGISAVQTDDIEIISHTITKARTEAKPFVLQFDLE